MQYGNLCQNTTQHMKWLLGIAIIGLLRVWWMVFAGTWCVSWGTCAVTTTVRVTISWWNICIGSSGVFDFGTFTVSSFSQMVTGAFATGYFFVDDLKGADSGYYTTVQMSWHLVASGWSAIISGSNVFLKTDSATPLLLYGQANPWVIIHPAATGFQSLDVARQLILRDPWPNNGIISMYGTLPLMQLIIPAYQAVWVYVGTMVFTLYEN